MILNRRHVLGGLALLALPACGGPAPAQGRAAADPAMRAVPNPGWRAWVDGFRARAGNYGLSAATVDAGFAGAGFIPGVIERDRNQTESRRSLEDYLAITAGEERVQQGRAATARVRPTLDALEARYGVPWSIIGAIWGIESRFGTRRGDIPVISATSTLAYDGRRGQFFEQQLVAALKILQSGDTTADRLVGSWAGAMGHTQFIPTSYQAFAVDFDGDGRRDIWSEDPADALASTAAYLNRNGWTRGLPWGGEEGSPGAQGRALQPQAGGPVFRVTSNFNVIKRYNNSDLYAVAVGYLSDRLAGAGPLRGAFPADAAGLTQADRQELQRRLTARGFDTGGADGVIGPGTRSAIGAYEASRGQPVTGEASRALLDSLR